MKSLKKICGKCGTYNKNTSIVCMQCNASLNKCKVVEYDENFVIETIEKDKKREKFINIAKKVVGVFAIIGLVFIIVIGADLETIWVYVVLNILSCLQLWCPEFLFQIEHGRWAQGSTEPSYDYVTYAYIVGFVTYLISVIVIIRLFI